MGINIFDLYTGCGFIKETYDFLKEDKGFIHIKVLFL